MVGIKFTFFFILIVILIGIGSGVSFNFYGFIIFLFILFLCSFAFYAGSISIKKGRVKPIYFKRKLNIYFLIILFLLSYLAILIAIQFYTGNTIIAIISNIINGNSNYVLYQIYFNESGIGDIPVKDKIIPLISLAYPHLIFYYFFPNFIINKKYLLSALIAIPLVIFSVSRGTGIELFMILSYYIYILLYCKNYKIIKISFIPVILISLPASIIFLTSSIVRGGIWITCSNDLFCPYENLISQILFKFASYFSHGIFYLTILFDKLNWFDFIKILLIGHVDLQERWLCLSLIDCGAKWSPPLEGLLYKFGLLFILIFNYLLGALQSYFLSKAYLNDSLYIFLSFIFSMMFISQFIGSGISINSSIAFVIILSFIYIIINKYLHIFKNNS
jgi:hypothetical protein